VLQEIVDDQGCRTVTYEVQLLEELRGDEQSVEAGKVSVDAIASSGSRQNHDIDNFTAPEIAVVSSLGEMRRSWRPRSRLVRVTYKANELYRVYCSCGFPHYMEMYCRHLYCIFIVTRPSAESVLSMIGPIWRQQQHPQASSEPSAALTRATPSHPSIIPQTHHNATLPPDYADLCHIQE
jgi:hypothetical protein